MKTSSSSSLVELPTLKLDDPQVINWFKEFLINKYKSLEGALIAVKDPNFPNIFGKNLYRKINKAAAELKAFIVYNKQEALNILLPPLKKELAK